MSRAHGRRGTGRTPDPQYGSFDKGIPGGIRHVDANEPAEQQEPAVAEPLEEFRGMMAHGVPPLDVGHYNREMAEHARHPYQPHSTRLPPVATPIPVYIVEREAGAKGLLSAAGHKIQVTFAGQEPTRLCSKDPDRYRVTLLNEDTVNLVRFANSPAELTGAQGQIPGAVLPAVTNSYLTLYTQDELWAIADTVSSPVFVSVILETYLKAGGAP